MASSPPLLALENLSCQLHPALPALNTPLNRDLDFILEFMAPCQAVSRLPLALRCLMHLGALALAVLRACCLQLHNLSLKPGGSNYQRLCGNIFPLLHWCCSHIIALPALPLQTPTALLRWILTESAGVRTAPPPSPSLSLVL